MDILQPGVKENKSVEGVEGSTSMGNVRTRQRFNVLNVKVRKKAVEVQQIRINKDISYAEAVKLVQMESRVEKKGKEIEEEHSTEHFVTKQ